MKQLLSPMLAALFLATLTGCCCGDDGCEPQTWGVPEETELSTDVAAFEEWVELPVTPATAQWRIDRYSGSGRVSYVGAEIVAVLTFEPGDLEDIHAQMATLPSTRAHVLTTYDNGSWWPGELTTMAAEWENIEFFGYSGESSVPVTFYNCNGFYEGKWKADDQVASIIRFGDTPYVLVRMASPIG
jgi:hypothetical protein